MDPWFYLTMGSGAVLALFGVFLLAADPRRDWNRVFALFAVFWGVQIVLANAVRIIDYLPLAHVLATLSLALLIPLYFFLVVFASIYPRPRAPFATSWRALLVLLVPAATSLILLLVAPRLLLDAVVPAQEGGSTMRWGALFPVLVLAPLYAGFFYALFAMMQRLEQAATSIERRQVFLVLLAVLVFVAYNVPLQLLLFGSAALGADERPEGIARTSDLIGLVMLAGFALLAVLATRLVRALRSAPTGGQARELQLLLAATTVAAAVGFTEAALDIAAGTRIQAAGVVRAFAVGLIGYGIARYQLFDLDLRMKNAVPIVTATLLAAIGAVLVWSLLSATDLALSPAVGFLVVLLVVFLALAAWLLHRLIPHRGSDKADAEARLGLRKLEVYQAALATAQGVDSQATLAALAARLELSNEDQALARRLAALRPAAYELAVGMLVFERYLIEAVIGRGAYGRVFLAKDLRLARGVVIKELEARWRGSPEVLGRFLREAKITGRLRHPSIVRIYEVERRGADHYLVLEHVEGGDLAARLRAGAVPVEDALGIVTGIAAALQVAHARGVIHRDLKPANILLDLEGTPKLADFGVAALYAETRDETLVGLPEPGGDEPAGNLQYMAPEQARGAAPDPRADLYALGAILFHMVVGRPHRVFHALDGVAAREQVARDSLPDLQQAPPVLRPILARLLEPDPAARIVDAASLHRSLDALQSQGRRRGGSRLQAAHGDAGPV